MGIAELLLRYPLECAYAIGSLSAFSLTETIKRDRKGRTNVRDLTRLELRAISGLFAAAMCAVVLLAFSQLPPNQIAAHAAIIGVLFPVGVSFLMMMIERKSPGAAKVIERAASGTSSLDDTRPFAGPPKERPTTQERANDQNGQQH